MRLKYTDNTYPITQSTSSSHKNNQNIAPSLNDSGTFYVSQ